MANLSFTLKSSRLLFIWLLLIHGGAIMILFCLPLAWWFTGILLSGCLLSLYYNIRVHAWRNHKTTINKFWRTETNQWQLQDNHGAIYPAELRKDHLRTRYWVLLNFQRSKPHARKSLLIPRDALDVESFRRIRVHLWQQRR